MVWCPGVTFVVLHDLIHEAEHLLVLVLARLVEHVDGTAQLGWRREKVRHKIIDDKLPGRM